MIITTTNSIEGYEIVERATEIGANAVVGLKMDYEMLGASNSMMMVTCSGTAVRIVKK